MDAVLEWASAMGHKLEPGGWLDRATRRPEWVAERTHSSIWPCDKGLPAEKHRIHQRWMRTFNGVRLAVGAPVSVVPGCLASCHVRWNDTTLGSRP